MESAIPNDQQLLPPREQQQQHPEGMGANLFVDYTNGPNMRQQPRMNGLDQDVMFGNQGLPMNLGNMPTQPAFVGNIDSSLDAGPSVDDNKRKLHEDEEPKPIKKLRTEEPAPLNLQLNLDEDDVNAPPPVPASKEGMSVFEDNDVLSGRGGGTNVHPGNRNFRDLINLHRRSYLKARKNDKPAISRAIVRAIRESGGRFLKKVDKSGLWYEIGDDAAREKTSQALRQRAPEMRKLLFDTEREEAKNLRQQRMIMGGVNSQGMMGQMGQMGQGMNEMPTNPVMNPAILQAMTANKIGNTQATPDFSSMFSAALLQGGINRFTPNGA